MLAGESVIDASGRLELPSGVALLVSASPTPAPIASAPGADGPLNLELAWPIQCEVEGVPRALTIVGPFWHPLPVDPSGPRPKRTTLTGLRAGQSITWAVMEIDSPLERAALLQPKHLATELGALHVIGHASYDLLFDNTADYSVAGNSAGFDLSAKGYIGAFLHVDVNPNVGGVAFSIMVARDTTPTELFSVTQTTAVSAANRLGSVEVAPGIVSGDLDAAGRHVAKAYRPSFVAVKWAPTGGPANAAGTVKLYGIRAGA